MSKYKVIQTEYRTYDSLKKALADLKLECEFAKDVKCPTLPLYGYANDQRPEQASIAMRRPVVNRYSGGASNDIGFAWNGQAFEAIVSDYDQSCPGVVEMLNRLKQRYAYHEINRQARLKGYTAVEQNMPDGSIRLTLTRR